MVGNCWTGKWENKMCEDELKFNDISTTSLSDRYRHRSQMKLDFDRGHCEAQIVFKEYSVEEIVSYEFSSHKSHFMTNSGGMYVGFSDRLKAMIVNQSCVWCGKTGNVFRLERDRYNNYTHKPKKATLNLYLIDDDNCILFTADHYIPIAKGGKKKDNLVLMCSICNNLKGSLLPLQFVAKIAGFNIVNKDTKYKNWSDQQRKYLTEIYNKNTH